MSTRSVGPALIALVVVATCAVAWRSPVAGLSAAELQQLQTLSLSQLPTLQPDPTNLHGDDPRAAALGQKLFFDTRLSSTGQVSCASCHVAERQFQDGTPVAKGVGTTGRRTMPVMATAYSPWQFWDGRKDSQWSQALGPLESAVEHGGTRLEHVRVISQHYRSEYEAIFGPVPSLNGLPLRGAPGADSALAAAWSTIPEARQVEVNHAFANIGKAIAAYERKVTYGQGRFDRYVAAVTAGGAITNEIALSEEELAGAKLFVGKGECINCHNGPLLTDQHFHNTGVPGSLDDVGRWAGVMQLRADEFNCLGRYSDAKPEQCEELQFLADDDSAMVRAYKTPSLRNVADRAPYMHAGQIATLDEVVAHYNRAPASPAGKSELRRLRLSARERAQLVAFLKTLTGEVVYPDSTRSVPAP